MCKPKLFSGFAVTIIFALAAAGCATTGSTGSTYAGAGQKNRFALVRSPAQRSTTDQAILKTLYSDLKARHYLPTKADGADLLVSYRILSVYVPQDASFRYGWAGPGVYSEEDFDRYYFPGNVHVYRTGSVNVPSGRPMHVLLVAVEDARTGQIVWEGWQTYSAGQNLSPGGARRIVSGVLSQMPAGGRARRAADWTG